MSRASEGPAAVPDGRRRSRARRRSPGGRAAISPISPAAARGLLRWRAAILVLSAGASDNARCKISAAECSAEARAASPTSRRDTLPRLRLAPAWLLYLPGFFRPQPVAGGAASPPHARLFALYAYYMCISRRALPLVFAFISSLFRLTFVHAPSGRARGPSFEVFVMLAAAGARAAAPLYL